MELFIFIAFQLLIEVQSNSSLQKPFISVSDDGVQINIACEIPDSVRADFTCSLYTEDDLLHSQRKQSGERLCMFYLTPGELFTRSVSRQLSCDYSLNTEPEIRSPRSDTQTIRGSTTTTAAQTNTTSTAAHPTTTTSTAQTTTTTSTAQTTTTSTAQTTTTTTSTAHPTTTTSTAQTTTATTAAHPTTTTSTAHTTRTATTSRVSSVHTSTAGPKDHQLTPLHRETWFIVLVSTGVGVILTGFICLCRFASKKRRKHNKMRSISSDVPSQGIGMSSGPAEIYSLITSVPATSQPMSVGLEHPDSHQDNTPDPTATSSFIMVENSIYQPSEDLVNTQQKQGNTEENENVYHLYCTIPDKPVQSNAADQVYSLVKMH
ncbi:cell wall protein DAN4-like isoform X2 [Megalobrama amblycephala]|uniref:cell wall protein DAN4-like isoform X2 n=1 Tax=Megalobrama amblycephala TaxID=75352 RepID=UPI0020147885|nr:cell wall protein DAN4-like isoform X2 [Megalobrama amblycephala]